MPAERPQDASVSKAPWVKISFTRPCGPGWSGSRQDPRNLDESRFIEVHEVAEDYDTPDPTAAPDSRRA
jgi:hypothetical protein